MPIHAPENRPRRVALYARVSGNRNRDARLQLDELRTVARQRGWQVVAEHTDVSIQGAKDRRPELHRLMQLVQRGMVDVVAGCSLGDFARSPRHLSAALDELRVHGVDFFAAQDAIDTTCSISHSHACVEREPDAGTPADRRGWPRAVRDLARARRLQTTAAGKAAQTVEPRSTELSEADIRRVMSRFVSMRFRDGSLVFPGMTFGPLVRAANPEELVRDLWLKPAG